MIPADHPGCRREGLCQKCRTIRDPAGLAVEHGPGCSRKERGTAALMLSKPLPRTSFILSKFLGVAVVLLTAILVAALGGYYYTLFLFEPLPVGTWLAFNGLMGLLLLLSPPSPSCSRPCSPPRRLPPGWHWVFTC